MSERAANCWEKVENIEEGGTPPLSNGNRTLNEINYWNLIKKKTVDEIRPLRNKKLIISTTIFSKAGQIGDRSQRGSSNQ